MGRLICARLRLRAARNHFCGTPPGADGHAVPVKSSRRQAPHVFVNAHADGVIDAKAACRAVGAGGEAAEPSTLGGTLVELFANQVVEEGGEDRPDLMLASERGPAIATHVSPRHFRTTKHEPE